jgi:hypothetical protein
MRPYVQTRTPPAEPVGPLVLDELPDTQRGVSGSVEPTQGASRSLSSRSSGHTPIEPGKAPSLVGRDTLPGLLGHPATKTTGSFAGLVLTLTPVVLSPALATAPALADGTKPYGDHVTGHIASQLRGTHRGVWLATVLDQGATDQPPRRRGEAAPTHGRRWVGVIHAPAGKGNQAARALSGVWFARKAPASSCR